MEHKMSYALWHYSFNLTYDIEYAQDDFHNHDYRPSGIKVGDILYILFEVTPSVYPKGVLPLLTPNDDTIVDLMKQFYLKAFKLDLDLTPCKNVAIEKSALVEELGIHIIKHGYEAEIVLHFILALKDFFDDTIAACPASADTERKGFEILLMMYDTNLTYYITKAYLFHYFSITKDVEDIERDFAIRPFRYGHAGYAMGEIVKFVLEAMGY